MCSLILSWTCLTCFLLASSDKIFPQWTHWNPVFWADTVTAISIFETTSPASIWGDIIGSFIYQSPALTHIVLWRLWWQKTCQKRRSAKVGQSWLPQYQKHRKSQLFVYNNFSISESFFWQITWRVFHPCVCSHACPIFAASQNLWRLDLRRGVWSHPRSLLRLSMNDFVLCENHNFLYTIVLFGYFSISEKKNIR